MDCLSLSWRTLLSSQRLRPTGVTPELLLGAREASSGGPTLRDSDSTSAAAACSALKSVTPAKLGPLKAARLGAGEK